MKTIRHKNKVLVFSRWTRKKYAVFASLGKIIQIARVSIPIGNKALNKLSCGFGVLHVFSLFEKELAAFLDMLESISNINAYEPELISLQNLNTQYAGQSNGLKKAYIPIKELMFYFNKAWAFLFLKSIEQLIKLVKEIRIKNEFTSRSI